MAHIDFTAGNRSDLRGQPDGNPDTKMWTSGARRRPAAHGRASMFTPYLDYDYVGAKLEAFVEDDGTAPA